MNSAVFFVHNNRLASRFPSYSCYVVNFPSPRSQVPACHDILLKLERFTWGQTSSGHPRPLVHTRSSELREEFPGGEAWGENQKVENQTTPNSAWEDEDQTFFGSFFFAQIILRNAHCKAKES